MRREPGWHALLTLALLPSLASAPRRLLEQVKDALDIAGCPLRACPRAEGTHRLRSIQTGV
jgi:hypothetical protein